MSYPTTRYLGGAGEVTATLRRAGHPRELTTRPAAAPTTSSPARRPAGRSGSTGGTWGRVRADRTRHFHKTISESFFVLSGAVRWYDGAHWIDATIGDFLFVPEGGIHEFRNESGEPVSMLILFAPGAPREDCFETLADATRREAMNAEQRVEFFARHDTHWL